MERSFVSRILDRVIANARVIRRAPEAVVLLGIVAVGYIAFQDLHRERLAVLNARIEQQEALLAEYRAKLKGATPAAAAAQVDQLTNQLRGAQKELDEAKSRLASPDNRTHDPRRLYEGGSAIAAVQDPKLDLDKKTITFPAVTAQVLLEMNKSYDFQDWKLTCGGTQFYNLISVGAAHEFSYSPLTCKIVGSR
jgi:hypothetical protein